VIRSVASQPRAHLQSIRGKLAACLEKERFRHTVLGSLFRDRQKHDAKKLQTFSTDIMHQKTKRQSGMTIPFKIIPL
jgi:hypothetical protein